MPFPTRRRRAALLATALAVPLAVPLAAAPHAAQAASYVVSFTGVITNSFDPGAFGQPGAIFGGAQEQGQTGQTIAGSFTLDTAAYPDSNGNAFIGIYGPTNGAFPQPANNFLSQYTISGQTFFPSTHMGQVPGHSTESAQVYPPYGVNFIQQDYIRIDDGSQFLFCADPQNGQTCTGGALRTDYMFIRLAAFVDFLANDGLEQTFSFDETALDAIRTAGGIAQGEYHHDYFPVGQPQSSFNANGEFRLTSITMGLQTTTEEPTGNAIPEPASLSLLAGASLAMLALRRRSRAARASFFRA